MPDTKSIVEEYNQKSKNPEYKNYSPLQCAAYDATKKEIGEARALEAVQALIQHYELSGPPEEAKQRIKTQLSYINSDDTKETILHVAMASPAIFKFICDTAEQNCPEILPTLFNHRDCDNDTLMHQFAEFGRAATLDMTLSSSGPGIIQILIQALTHKNHFDETPVDILNLGLESKTMQHLTTGDEDLGEDPIMSSEKVAGFSANQERLSTLFQALVTRQQVAKQAEQDKSAGQTIQNPRI